MSDGQVFVVYSSGPEGQGYPYGVFTSEEAAEEAREEVLASLKETQGEKGMELRNVMWGSLDEQITIEECELRSEFDEDDLDDLFMDV